jgi:hypothetical protein
VPKVPRRHSPEKLIQQGSDRFGDASKYLRFVFVIGEKKPDAVSLFVGKRTKTRRVSSYAQPVRSNGLLTRVASNGRAQNGIRSPGIAVDSSGRLVN